MVLIVLKAILVDQHKMKTSTSDKENRHINLPYHKNFLWLGKTAKKAAIQQPLLSNGFANRHDSMATILQQ
jgi:hypothetical protein